MTISLDNGASSGGGEAVLDNVLEELANCLQAGELVDHEAILARFPAQAESLRQLLPTMELMAQLATSAGEMRERRSSAAFDPLEAGLGVLGDFRVVREVGRGGMGVVYEAEQISLGRRVAVKVLPFAAALDSHQLQRFKTEAQAAAQLHHTNIVPVFSVGCEAGVHYYAMQFIEGRTLAGLIRDQQSEALARREDDTSTRSASTSTAPLEPRTVEEYRRIARLGIQAAEALEHAHRLGIVHRDVKPANLLVDVHDNLWVTDFGLARFLNDSGLTLTGDLLGTLRYMSPEQALAKRVVVDQRTDIYSLGATLYELLTLRPAVEGADRLEVLRKIAQEEPVAPRRIDESIPRDLETILLKTLAKEPEARYATAGDLALDLRRFLEHRPIKARRPSLFERTAKWARRHPALVVSAVSVLLLAVIGLSASLVAVDRERSRTAGKARQLEEKSKEFRRLADTREWELYVSRVNQAQGDYDTGNMTRALATLDACPEAHRNWEWRCVQRLCHLERYAVRAEKFSEGANRLPVLFMPDGGSWVAAAPTGDSAHRSSTLKLWDTATGRCLEDMVPEGLPRITSLAASPDGSLIAVGFEALGLPTQVRRMPDGAVVHELRGPRPLGSSWDMAFSPDGRRLVEGRDCGTVVVWDIAAAKAVREFAAHPEYAFAVAFHPGGRLVASGGKDGLIQLWDSTSGARLDTIKRHEGAVFDLEFSSDGRRLVSGGWDQILRVWDVETRGLVVAIPCESGFIVRTAFLPGNDRVVSSSGECVTIWSAETGRALFKVNGRNQVGGGVDFSRDGAFSVTTTSDGTFRLWETARSLPRVLRTAEWVNQVAFSPDGSKVVTAGAGGLVEIWNTGTGEAVQTMKGHTGPVRSACFTPDGTWAVSTLWDASAGIWDVATGRELRTIVWPDRARHGGKRVAPDPRVASAINQGCLSPDGTRLATASWDGSVHVWEIPSGTERLRYSGHGRIVWAVAYSPDGTKVASLGADRTLRVWDSQTGRDLWTSAVSVCEFTTIQRQMLAFSHDGGLLASCDGYEPSGPCTVKLWDAATGALARTLGNGGSQVNAVTFSPDDTRIATASEGRTVNLWDTASGQNVFVLRGHTASVLAVAFSPDGQRLASGSADATVRIWDAPHILDHRLTADGAAEPSATLSPP